MSWEIESWKKNLRIYLNVAEDYIILRNLTRSKRWVDTWLVPVVAHHANVTKNFCHVIFASDSTTVSISLVYINLLYHYHYIYISRFSVTNFAEYTWQITWSITGGDIFQAKKGWQITDIILKVWWINPCAF